MALKPASPLLGFNNNVKHKGRIFHIQTEDSGVKHPHVITHLFADGGRILKTTKTSYAEHIGADAMSEKVRQMMQEQHKAMFIALRDGQFDHFFDDTRAHGNTAPPVPAAPKPPVEPPPAPAVAVAVAEVDAPPPSAGPKRKISRPEIALDPRVLAAPTEPRADPAIIHTPGNRVVSPTATTQAISAQAAPAAAAPSSPIELDLDALERAASEAQTPFFQQIQDLPPPPATVLGGRPAMKSSPGGGGTYRSVTPLQGTPAGEKAPAPPVEVIKQPQTAGAGRYAPSRPAAIFANARPAEGASIFGEDLISEKSLDEVILSYLAEDLDGPPPKK